MQDSQCVDTIESIVSCRRSMCRYYKAHSLMQKIHCFDTMEPGITYRPDVVEGTETDMEMHLRVWAQSTIKKLVLLFSESKKIKKIEKRKTFSKSFRISILSGMWAAPTPSDEPPLGSLVPPG